MEINAQDIDIEKELLTNKSLNREDLKKIREWIEENYSYSLKPSDLQLFLFLHSCYYDIELAKKTAISYYQLRAEWPEAMKNRNPTRSPLKEQLDVSAIWKLQGITEEGYYVLYGRLMNFDSNNYDFELQCKMSIAIIEFWLDKVGNCEGMIVVMDVNGFTWGHLSKININSLRKFVTYVQEAAPIRLKGFHAINSNAIIEKFYSMCKLVIHTDLYALVHLHSTLDTLEEHVPKRYLPSDYGGGDVSVKKIHEQIKTTLMENVEFFAKDDQEDINEPPSRFTYLNID